jgi:hypothetical protein
MASQYDSHSAQLIQLHTAVLGGYLAAIELLTAILLNSGRRILRPRFSNVDVAIINDAVEDAILRYLVAPYRYDVTRARLDTFILGDARHRVLHCLRAERRRLQHQQLLIPTAHPWGLAEASDNASDERAAAMLNAVAVGQERAFLVAKLRGERRTVALAHILGAAHLPKPEQARVVKRAADRLRARLRRFVETPARLPA